MMGPSPGGKPGDDYEYWGLITEAWDVLRADAPSWPDVAFYRSVIQSSGQPVLDVGCATGRLVLAYLEEGIDADALDVSPEMLAIVSRKAAERGVDVSGRLFQQQLENLTLPRLGRATLVGLVVAVIVIMAVVRDMGELRPTPAKATLPAAQRSSTPVYWALALRVLPAFSASNSRCSRTARAHGCSVVARGRCSLSTRSPCA
jgi:SAM-dependent methyltransferase